MNKLFRIIAGLIFVAIGLSVATFCVYQAWRGQWLWLVAAILGAAIGWSGVRLMLGDKVRDIVEDLLFVFIRTH